MKHMVRLVLEKKGMEIGGSRESGDGQGAPTHVNDKRRAIRDEVDTIVVPSGRFSVFLKKIAYSIK